MSENEPTSRPVRDLRGYGRIEAFNALLVPGLSAYYGWPRDVVGGIVLTVANLGVIIGLIVGALYWLAVAKRLGGNPLPMSRTLKIADRAQVPMITIVCAAALGVTALIALRGFSFSTGVAAVIALLGALEYVNYYHIQLQHFDNLPDLRRLLAGRGFKSAHMARDLKAWRLHRQRTA